MYSYARFQENKLLDNKTVEGCYEIIINSLKYKLNGMILYICGTNEEDLNWITYITKYLNM